MVTFLIFLALTVIQFIIIYIKWNEVSDVNKILKLILSILGLEDKYNILVSQLKSMKPLLWILGFSMLIINLITAFILSFLFSIMYNLIVQLLAN